MLLGPLLAQYEEELIAVGEEAESLSFAYRALKNWTFTDFVLALQKEVEVEDQALLDSIFEQLKHHVPAQYILSLIHISEPTRLGMISYAVFCLKKKKKILENTNAC